MSTSSFPAPTAPAAQCDPFEEALSLYVDGELETEHQAALFAHLAACEGCRSLLESVLLLRGVVRRERILVSPAQDDALFKRVAVARRRWVVGRPAADRSAWQVRTPVSVRVAVMAFVLVFCAGLLMPVHTGLPQPERSSSTVQGIEEVVEFEPAVRRSEAVYVFYPGLTIEAPRIEEPGDLDPL